MAANDTSPIRAAVPDAGANGNGNGAGAGIHWDLLIQALGVAAGLVAWLAMVGAARTWARLEAMNVPALPTLAALDQSWFVVEGLQVLALPVLLGGLTGLVVYFTWPNPPTDAAAGDAAEPRNPEEPAPARETNPDAESEAARAERIRRSDPGSTTEPPDTGPGTSGPAAPAPAATSTVEPRRSSRFRRLRPVDNVVRIAAGQGGSAWTWAIPAAAAMFGIAFLLTEADWRVFAVAIAAAGLLLIMAWILFVRAGRAAARDGEPTAQPVARVGRPEAVTAARGGEEAPPATSADSSAEGETSPGAVSAGGSAAAIGRGQQVNRRVLFGLGLVVLAVAVLIGGYFAGILLAMHTIHVWIICSVTLVGIWITLGAVDVQRPGRTALVLFVAVVAWSGALAYAQEAGNRNPEVTSATVRFKAGGEQDGGYLGQAADRVLLATPLDPSHPDAERDVLILPADDIAQITLKDMVTVGPPSSAPQSSAPKPSAPQPSGTRPPGTSTPLLTRPGTTAPNPTAGRRSGAAANSGAVIVGPETPIASRNATAGGLAVQLQVLALVRQAGRYVELDALVVNLSPQPVTPATVFGRGPAFDAVELFDPGRRLVHSVVRADGRCVCTTGLDGVTIPPGAATLLSAAFEAPDRLSSRVDMLFPTFGWLRNVQLT